MSGPGQTSVPKTSSPASPPTTSAVTHRYMLKLSFVFNYSMLRFEWITSHNRSASSGPTLTVHSHLVNTSTDSDCVYLFLRTASFVAQSACRWIAYGSPQLMETYMIRHILLVLYLHCQVSVQLVYVWVSGRWWSQHVSSLEVQNKKQISHITSVWEMRSYSHVMCRRLVEGFEFFDACLPLA